MKSGAGIDHMIPRRMGLPDCRSSQGWCQGGQWIGSPDWQSQTFVVMYWHNDLEVSSDQHRTRHRPYRPEIDRLPSGPSPMVAGRSLRFFPTAVTAEGGASPDPATLPGASDTAPEPVTAESWLLRFDCGSGASPARSCHYSDFLCFCLGSTVSIRLHFKH